MDETLFQFERGGAFGLAAVLVVVSLLAFVQEWVWKMRVHANKPQSQPFKPPLIDSRLQTYQLCEQIGVGDLSDVYRAECQDSEYVVKIARDFEVKRLMEKEITILEQLREQAGDSIHRAFFPDPMESFVWEGKPVNVWVHRPGLYSAEQIRNRHSYGVDARHLGWMFNRMLEALGYVHRQGYVHGAVLPAHSLFQTENHGLMLAGWIHAERIGTALKLVPEQYKFWYPPECHNRQPATPSVDMYLAVKTLIYLAGGDPDRNPFPDHIPSKMQRFFKSCLLESPGMRPQDAWELREEFGGLLEDLFGPPAFHDLEMT